MKNIFKSLVILLIFTICLSSLVSCERDREYDEGEVLSVARELIEKSKLLNEIYYGAGIPCTTDASGANGYYYEADIRFLMENGFETLADLRKMTSDVFTEGYCNLIFSTKLSSVVDEDSVQSMSRYYQKYSDREGKEPECIMVYTKAINLLTGDIIYDFTSLKVHDVEGEVVIVSLNASVYNDKGDSQTATLKIRMLEENEGWRIDSPTYKVYNSSLSEYENLQK